MFRLTLVALATVMVVIACERVPLTSPTGSTIALTIDRDILPVNGQATVTAIVTESSGTPVHNGTVVTFQPSQGRTDPPEAQTVNGRATATYIAPSVAGTFTINAYSGGASTVASGNSSASGIQVRVGAAAAETVTLNAVPVSVPTSGGTVTLTARVVDIAGNPLPGVGVSFSTTAGALATTTAFTDSNGAAVTTLSTSQAARVTATAAAKTSPAIEIGVTASPTPTITVSGTPIANQPVSFTVTPATGGNTSPTRTISVDFGDGTAPDVRSNPTGPYGLTHTYTRAQGYTATATATDSNGASAHSSVSVIVGHAGQPSVTVSLNPATGINVNEEVVFTITATPASGTGSAPIRSVVATIDGTDRYNGTSSGSFVASFATPGSRTVTVVVRDANGEQGSTQTTFVVNP